MMYYLCQVPRSLIQFSRSGKFQIKQDDNNTKKKRNSVVKLIRSQRETRVQFIFKGNLGETENRLQKLYKAVMKVSDSKE